METNSVVEEFKSKQAEKSQKMARLLTNDLFVELIIEDFIKSGIVEQALTQNLSSEATTDELKARQILHNYIFNSIIVSE